MKKTLLVGLDAACWEYLNPLLEMGQMPVLRQLIDSGISGTLQSTMPPWTPTAWASIVTGKNPGKHGVFDMLWRRPGTYEFTPTNANVRMGTPFWKYLNNQGIRVGLVNIPFTYPPREVTGFVVCGFGTPNSAANPTYPIELSQWIKANYSDYTPAIDGKFLRTASPQEIFQAEREHQKRQVEIAVQFADRYQVNVLAINLMFTDHANHKMPTMEQVQQAYYAADDDLQTLIQRFRPDNVMLMSDHGSNRLQGNFLLNAWLRDRGYYIEKENNPSDRSNALNWILIRWLQEHHGWSGPQEKFLRRLARDGLLKLPDRIKDKFWSVVDDHIPFAKEFVLMSDEPDFSKTKLFPGSVYSGLLYLNLTAREINGIVPPNKKNTLTSEISRKLLEIEEPGTGDPLFSDVYLAEEIYTGPATAHAPELILDSYDKGWNIQASKFVPVKETSKEKYFFSLGRQRDYGWHSRDGIFVFSGQDFSTGTASGKGHVMDIPATLLHLYNTPIPEDYDGQVLLESLNLEFSRQPICHQPGDPLEQISSDDSTAYTDEEAEELVNHLKALGYLD